MEYSIYCDESCHLENDGIAVMALGAVWCPLNSRKEVFERIREIKVKHKLNPYFEIKWNKVSESKIDLYLDLINYFFDNDDLHYRGLIIPDKTALNHDYFNQNHDTFYYKMYFDLLKVILDPDSSYNIYIDIKDTQSQEKVVKLLEVLRNNHYDFNNKIIKKIQQVQSHQIEILQITDLITGALGYLHRGLNTNKGKEILIKRLQYRSNYSLLKTTLYKEEKMNVFVWKAKEVGNV